MMLSGTDDLNNTSVISNRQAQPIFLGVLISRANIWARGFRLRNTDIRLENCPKTEKIHF